MKYTNQAMRPCRSNLCYKDTVLKIERIARICYKSFDKSDGTITGAEKLIRFLIKNDHTAMIEPVSLTFYIKTNRNIANEIVRHRIASYCVSGDTEVFTDLASRGVRKRTVRELFELPKQYLDMTHIRSVDLDTKELIGNKIKNVYKTGKKEVYKVTTNLGYEIKTTLEHRFYTDNGWKRLKELSIGDEVYTNGELAYRNKEWLNRKYNIENLRQEDIAKLCRVSKHTIRAWVKKFNLQKANSEWNIGRVPTNKGKNKYNYPPLMETSKKMKGRCTHFIGYGEDNPAWKGDDISIRGGYARVHRNYDKTGVCEICGKNAKTEIHHKDTNPKNNSPENLMELCVSCHKAEHKGAVVKVIRKDTIKSIERVGLEETYDIEMEAPHHNFIGNGFVVHNSQESTRYVNYGGKEMEFIPCKELTNYAHVEEFYTEAEKIYKSLVNEGIPPQVARDVLPGAVSTNISTTFNLRSLRNFLKLRTAKTAHPQMRELAGMILEYVKREYPIFFEDICIDTRTKEA